MQAGSQTCSCDDAEDGPFVPVELRPGGEVEEEEAAGLQAGKVVRLDWDCRLHRLTQYSVWMRRSEERTRLRAQNILSPGPEGGHLLY